ETDSTGMTGVEPGDLLGDHRRRPQWQQQRAGCSPSSVGVFEDEAHHLQRQRHVPGEPAMVLARHDPVEAAVECQLCLRTYLAHDARRVEIVVRVQTTRDRFRREWCGAGHWCL